MKIKENGRNSTFVQRTCAKNCKSFTQIYGGGDSYIDKVRECCETNLCNGNTNTAILLVPHATSMIFGLVICSLLFIM